MGPDASQQRLGSAPEDAPLRTNKPLTNKPLTQPPKGRAPLTRARVLQAALAIVDRGGVESLSMRTVAATLGVEAMSLYHHVASKEALVEGIVELVLAEIAVPPAGTPWREAMRSRSRSAREVFLRHPAATLVVESCATMTPARLAYADAILGLLMADGFSATLAYQAFLTLDSYVYGFMLQELGWPHPADTQPTEDAATSPTIPPELFPHFAAVMGAVMGEVGRIGLVAAYEAEFMFGLELVLDGLGRMRADRLAANA